MSPRLYTHHGTTARFFFTMIITIMIILMCGNTIFGQFNFSMQQIPLTRSDTYLKFQSHFVCDPNSSPCDRTWNFTWNGFKQYDDTFIKSVELYLYDLNEYNTTKIVLNNPDDLNYYTSLVNIDINQDIETKFTVFGFVEYSTPIPLDVPLATFAAKYSFHVIQQTRYVCHLLPGVADPFSSTVPQIQLHPRALEHQDDTDDNANNVELINNYDNNNNNTIKINNDQQNKQQFQPIQHSITPKQTFLNNQTIYIAPSITFTFPFYSLPSEYRMQALDPEKPQILTKIYFSLFGFAKWAEDAEIPHNNNNINNDSNNNNKTRMSDNNNNNNNDNNDNAIPRLCYLNGVAVPVGIDRTTQDQILVVLVYTDVYQHVIQPMLRLNQSKLHFHCNNNFWMYYHYTPAQQPSSLHHNYNSYNNNNNTHDDNNDNNNTSSPSSSSSTTPIFIPDELMTIIFLNTAAATVTTPTNIDNTTSQINNFNNDMYQTTIKQVLLEPIVDIHRNNNPCHQPTPSLPQITNDINIMPMATTWLPVADIMPYNKDIYINITNNYLSTPRLDLIDTEIITHTNLSLPWEKKVKLDDNNHILGDKDDIKTFQHSWIKCSYAMDWSENEWLRYNFNPKTMKFTMEIETALSYAFQNENKQAIFTDLVHDNINDNYDEKPMYKLPPSFPHALLIIHPSSELSVDTKFDSKPQSWYIPQSYYPHPNTTTTSGTTYVSHEFTYQSTEPLLLTKNLRELFPHGYYKLNETDYTYLQKQYYTIYYPIDISVSKNGMQTYDIIPESLHCGLQIKYNFILENDDDNDDVAKETNFDNDGYNNKHNNSNNDNNHIDDHLLEPRINKTTTASFVTQYQPVYIKPEQQQQQQQQCNWFQNNDHKFHQTTSAPCQDDHNTQQLLPNLLKVHKLSSDDDVENVQSIQFDLINNDYGSIQLSIDMDTVINASNAPIQFITIYPITGLHVFKIETDGVGSSDDGNDSSSLCTSNLNGWKVETSFNGKRVMSYLRLEFEKNDDTTTKTTKTTTNLTKSAKVIIYCKHLTMVQISPHHHNEDKAKEKKENNNDKEINTRNNNVDTTTTTTAATTFESTQYINHSDNTTTIIPYPPYLPHKMFKPYEGVTIYDTLLFNFQYKNDTHYLISEYNIPNPYRSIPNESLIWLYILIIVGVCLGVLVGLGIMRYCLARRCSDDNNGSDDKDSEYINAHYLSLNYDDERALVIQQHDEAGREEL